MKRFAPAILMLFAACSGDEGSADLTPSSSQSEIVTESKSIERAAEKAAALIEADANGEISAQETSDKATAPKQPRGE